MSGGRRPPLMGFSGFRVFHFHAGVASHHLLGELPSAVPTTHISVDLSIPPSGRSSALLAGCLWSKQANDAQFSHCGDALWRIVRTSRKKDALCKSTPCLLDCLELGKRETWGPPVTVAISCAARGRQRAEMSH